ncbi:unnamed protein product [Haemonchus placei]|uniref:Rab-GAP TBC domain-containing protein n=1 Tax=Haemonchus placei TaxID=6290 RepID=A0A0N4VTS5_HAEPC|nr:unnamed protein product [Haemonchus placei]
MLSSTVFVHDLVYDWMLQAATYDTFGSVGTVLRNLSMDVLIEKFLDERAFEDLAIEEHRPMMTWKCISLARVVDDKRLTQILREIVAAWPKRRGAIPAAEMITSVEELIKLAHNYPNVGRTCFTLFKSDTGAVMCSEFGFLLVLALCKINRYKASMIAELTKTFQKLWNFKENVHEAGCTETSGLSEIVDLVEEQVSYTHHCSQIWVFKTLLLLLSSL